MISVSLLEKKKAFYWHLEHPVPGATGTFESCQLHFHFVLEHSGSNVGHEQQKVGNKKPTIERPS